MHTWLIELMFGLAGVLSTVTMVSPYGPRIAVQLIRLSKYRWNWLFLSTVNLELRPFAKCDIASITSNMGVCAGVTATDSRLLKHEQLPLRSPIR